MDNIPVSDLPPRPYPGLRSFNTDERAIFFGRDAQIFFMTERLETERFLCITGPSGCGKSSLARTGLISGLRAGLVEVGSDWIIIDTHPGNDPFSELARAIGKALAPKLNLDSDFGRGTTKIDLTDVIYGSMERLQHNLNKVLAQYSMFQDGPILLLIDQFEEIFGFATEAPEKAASFIRMILDAIQPMSGIDLYLAITVRADALDACARYDGLAEAINRGQFLTPALSREELSEIIRGPIALYDGDIDPALVGWLLNQVAQEPDRLPLLQHAVNILWVDEKSRIDAGVNQTSYPHLDLTDFIRNFDKAYGRASAPGDALRFALSDRLDSVYEDLPEGLKPLTRKIFCALVEIFSGDRDIKRRLTIDELTAVTGGRSADVITVVDHFRSPDRQYLSPGMSEEEKLKGDTTIRVMHESLLRQWSQLRNVWMQDYERAIIELQFLARSAMSHATQKGPYFGRTQLEYYKRWKRENGPTKSWGVPFLNAVDWYEDGKALPPEVVFDRSLEFLDISEKKVNVIENQKSRRTKRQRFTWTSGLVLGSLAVASFFFLESYTQLTQDKNLESSLQELESRRILTEVVRLYSPARDIDPCGPTLNENSRVPSDRTTEVVSIECETSDESIQFERIAQTLPDFVVASDDVATQTSVRKAIEEAINEKREADRIAREEFVVGPNLPQPIAALEALPLFLDASLDGQLLQCREQEISAALAEISANDWIEDITFAACTPQEGRQVHEDVPAVASEVFEKGLESFESKDFDDALARFSEAYETAPNVPRLYRYLGWTLLEKAPPSDALAWSCFSTAVTEACKIENPISRDEQLLWGWSNLTAVPERQDATGFAAAAWAQKALLYVQNTVYSPASLQKELRHPYRKFEAFANAAKGFRSVGGCIEGQGDVRFCSAVRPYFERAHEQLLAFQDRFPSGNTTLRQTGWLNTAAWEWVTNSELRQFDQDENTLQEFFLESTEKAAEENGKRTPSIYITISMLKCLVGDIEGAIDSVADWPATTLSDRRARAQRCIDEGS